MLDNMTLMICDYFPRYGQDHVLRWWPDLSHKERGQLASELAEVDLEEMTSMWRRTCGEDSLQSRDTTSMIPMEAELCESVTTAGDEKIRRYSDVALRAASEGHVGVLLLAGGQGTRLGVNYPKVDKHI